MKISTQIVFVVLATMLQVNSAFFLPWLFEDSVPDYPEMYYYSPYGQTAMVRPTRPRRPRSTAKPQGRTFVQIARRINGMQYYNFRKIPYPGQPFHPQN